jgi:ADP-ribose pyrophosphatase YjhB (NUDIX family)
MLTRNSHCSFCGDAFTLNQSWPRRCESCEQVTYTNPVPVAVALLPVGDAVLVIRRAIAPGAGLLALPGGFVDTGESWQAAVVRELREETGIGMPAEEVALFDVLSAPDGTLLVFGLLPNVEAGDLPEPLVNEETDGWELIRQPQKMAFDLHATVLNRFFGA